MLTRELLADSFVGVAPTKQLGTWAELAIAADLARRGYPLLFPVGEDCNFDLAIEREGMLERVQVKYSRSRDGVIPVRCVSHSLTKGVVRQTKRYTATMIEWLAVFDGKTQRCFYVPSSELGAGRSLLHLRLDPPANNQVKGIRLAADYEGLPPPIALRAGPEVEPAGIEPATSNLQNSRSPN